MKYFALLFAGLLTCQFVFGQSPYYIQLDKSNGLPCNEIYNLHQDKNGYIWIATDLGLYRYDGFEFKGYFTTNMSSKSGSYIREDEKGKIWYSTFDAKLFYIEKDSLKAFGSENGLSQNVEYAIIGNKIIALGRDNALLISDIYSRKIIHKIAIKPIYTSLFQIGNEFSIGCGSSMDFFNENGKCLRTFHAEAGNIIYKVEPYQGKFYSLEIGNNVMYVFEITNNEKKLIYRESQNALVNGLTCIENMLYVLKKDGITQINLINREVNTQILKGRSASYIIKDNRGFLWISSSFDGISIFPSSATFVSYDLPLVSSKIRIIGNEFLLFNGKGSMYTFDLSTNKFQHIFTDKKKSSIYDVVPFNKGELNAVIEDQNKFNLSYKNWSLFVLKSGLKEINRVNSKYIATAFTGNAGLIRLNINKPGLWDSIALKYRDTSVTYQPTLSSFASNIRAKSVTFDSINQILYYATNVGIIKVTPRQVDELLFKQQKIYAAKVMFYKGNLLIYLHSGEILTKRNRDEVTFNETLNLNSPYKFVKQQDSLLFLGTEKELFYINLDCENWEFKQIPFSKLVSELNDIVAYQNHFYLSVNDQLIKINKSNIVDTQEIPFYINSIESNAHKYYTTLNLTFTSAERDIKVNFSALDYFHNNPNILYKINGGIWRKSDANTRTILLASLAPDDYAISFSVNGKLYNNIIQFSIKKRWYLRWWSLSLIACALSLTVFLYYKRRLRSSQKESKLLLEKANLEKDLRQSMLSGIKSQMNPHFLFNALNTIQSYIITEDKTNASNYLSKFSKLTRKILEMSDKETISLQEEIETLILYIDLEKMRFQELNYVIEIDKDINSNEILIPSMIIQPYVENAIKHGLLHKDGDKQLFIRIGKLDKNLLIQIEDNGIGRNQSTIINKSKGNKHHSFAAHANMKRVELLNIEKNEIGIEYIDKIDANGKAIGTTINIKIPIKE